MKIYIDPGHGGDSIGASYKGRLEQDDCLRLAQAVRDCLLTQKDVQVRLSREGNTNPDLVKRAEDANSWGADYFLSIHRNAFTPEGATGAEIWVYSKVATDGETYRIAENILNSLCLSSGYRNRGVKKGAPAYTDYAVNSYTKMHSALLEVGFIDNTKDNEIFDRSFSEIALEIAKGLYEAMKGEWTDSVPAEKPSSAGLTYIVQAGAFTDKALAEAHAQKIKKAGFDAFVTVKGDVDGDGRVSAADGRAALSISVGREV